MPEDKKVQLLDDINMLNSAERLAIWLMRKSTSERTAIIILELAKNYVESYAERLDDLFGAEAEAQQILRSLLDTGVYS